MINTNGEHYGTTYNLAKKAVKEIPCKKKAFKRIRTI